MNVEKKANAQLQSLAVDDLTDSFGFVVATKCLALARPHSSWHQEKTPVFNFEQIPNKQLGKQLPFPCEFGAVT